MHPLAAAIARVSLKNLDKYIETRKSNLDYMTQALENSLVITPPRTQSYVTRGAFYGYKPLFVPLEAQGVHLGTYMKALQAEGLDIHEPGSKPLHLLPLFQTVKDGMYNYCCPRGCPHVKHTFIYKQGAFPVSEDIYARSMSFPTFTNSTDITIVEKYIEAIYKVENHLDDLLYYQLNKT